MLQDKNVYSLSEEYYTLKIFQVYLFKYFTFKIENESVLTKQNIRPPGLGRSFNFTRFVWVTVFFLSSVAFVL